MNTLNAPDLVTETQARSLLNVQSNPVGAIVKRNGLYTWVTPTVILNSLFPYEAGLSGFLIGAGGTSLYSFTPAGVQATIATGLTNNAPWEFVQSQVTGGQGPVYGMNGIDAPRQWSGSGSAANWTATSGTLQNGKYMILAGNRIWVTGVASSPSRVYFSDLIPVNNGPVTWPSQNVAVFDENDGSPITGIAHLGATILIAKARKLYVITDLNTGDARRLSDNVGCASHRSMCPSPEGTYFLAEDRGVYLTDGSHVSSLSDLIQPTLDNITDRTKAAAAYYNAHYYLSVQGLASTNNLILDYDVTLKSWWVHSIGSSQFAVWHPGATAGLFSAKPTAAFIDQCFVPNVVTDNGNPFAWVWRGSWKSPTFYRRRRFDTPYFKKRFRQLRFQGEGSVDFSLAVDFIPAETLKQSNVFGGSSDVSDARIFTLGVWKAISPVFSSTPGSATADAVYFYELSVTDRRDMVPS